MYELVLADEFSVLQATRGAQGFDLAVEQLPDAIVMDVGLPDIDGLEICERLHANPSTAQIPILVLTGSDEAYARAHLLRHELTGVLMKPCPGDRLVGALKLAIERGRRTA